MSRMNKEDYIQELRALGEEAPLSWTIPEIKLRILEIKEENGMPTQKMGKKSTPFRILVIAMNKCKKKAELQEFARETMKVHVNLNDAIQELQKKCLRRIYETTPATGMDPVGFGQHCSLTYCMVFFNYKIKINRLYVHFNMVYVQA